MIKPGNLMKKQGKFGFKNAPCKVHFQKATSVRNILEPFTLTAIKNIMNGNKV